MLFIIMVCLTVGLALRNMAHEPESLGDDLMATILNCDAVTLIEEMKILKDVTTGNIMDFVKRFLSAFSVEGLIYGNTDKEQSLEMIDYFHKRLGQSPLRRSGAEPLRVLQVAAMIRQTLNG